MRPIPVVLPVLLAAALGGCPADSAPTVFLEPLGTPIYLGPPGGSSTHILVNLQRGDGMTGDTYRVRSRVVLKGKTYEALLPEAGAKRMDYPISYAVVFDQPPREPVQLEAEALAQDSHVQGRAKTSVETDANAGVNVEMRLGQACDSAAQCDDGKRCTGVETCLEGVCVPGTPPCPPSSLACVSVACREEATGCDVTLDDTRCGPLPGPDGLTHAAWCHRDLGCVVNTCGDGRRDPTLEECDDGNASNEDSCLKTCKSNVCGDGFVDATLLPTGAPTEACDDANENPNDGCHACQRTSWEPAVLLGFGLSAGDPLRLPLTYPEGVALDRQGNLYFAEWLAPRLWRVDVSGKITLVAGTGQSGYSGDNGPATSAQVAEPEALVLDGRGAIFFSDSGNHVVRKIDTRGTITTVAGTGVPGCSGEDSAGALRTDLNYPRGLALDGMGNLYVADAYNNRVRRITPTGDVSTVTGECGLDPGVDAGAAEPPLVFPTGLLLQEDGSLLVTEERNHKVRRVELGTGALSTVAGTGERGYQDGPGLQAKLAGPAGMTRLPDGSVLVAEWEGHRIRRLTPDGALETWAGTGVAGSDDAPTTAAQAHFNQPLYLAAARSGEVFIADEYNQQVRRVAADSARTVSTVVGLTGPVYAGYGSRALTAFMQGPNGVAVGPDGSVYVAEYEAHRVRRLYPSTGMIETVLGTGQGGFNGDGRGTATQVSFPDSLAMDSAGNLYVTDSGNNRVRKVDPAGNVTTVAGPGDAEADACGDLGDNGPATQASLSGPSGIARDEAGNLYFSDAKHHRIRRIAADGTITTVAGDCTEEYAPTDENALATAVGIGHVYGIGLDSAGNLFMADDGFNRVRMVRKQDGRVQSVAGDGRATSGPDNAPALQTSLNQPGAVAVLEGTDFRHLYISETYGHRIRRVDLNSGMMETVVGTGENGFYGDFGPGTSALINLPYQLAFEGHSRLFIGDYGNGLVRRLDVAEGTLDTVGGMVHPGDGPLEVAKLTNPQAVVMLPQSWGWLVADGEGGRVRHVDTPGGSGTRLLETVAGYPRAGNENGLAALTRLFNAADGVAYVEEGNPLQRHVYVTERNGHTLRRLVLGSAPESPGTWHVETVSGVNGQAGHHDGPLASALFAGPAGLAWDGTRHVLYVAEVDNHDVRGIQLETPEVGLPLCSPVPCVETVAGTPGTLGFYGEDVPASDALLDSPEAVAVGIHGDLYLADTGNHRVRRMDILTGTISTVLGDGSPNSSGEGAPARFLPVDTPRGVAVDGFGNLFITSRNTVRVVSAGADGKATGDTAVRTIYGTLPRDTFPTSVTRCLSGVAVQPGGDKTLLLDSCQGFLMELSRK